MQQPSEPAMDWDDYPGWSAVNYGNQSSWRYPEHPHTKVLDEALYRTYYKDMNNAYQLIGEIYDEFCRAPGEPALVSTKVRV